MKAESNNPAPNQPKGTILLLGSTGKMGTAIEGVFEDGYSITGKNTSNFDALKFEQVRNLIEENNPDIVINTVAFLGIDPCEEDPHMALTLNTLYPKLLAELSNEKRFLLVHFSTDAVFDNNEKGNLYSESALPRPVNIYGFTKYGGDCFIQAIAKEYYIFRISVLFGEAVKHIQFVEKMLLKIKEGSKSLKISDDIISSPTYSKDIAREVRRIIEASYPYGLYHIASGEKASLFELMKEIVENLNLDVRIEKASYKDFPFVGTKNTCTPIRSEKVNSLRPWREALKEYCTTIKTFTQQS